MIRSPRQQMELILSLTKRDLKARYKDSALGFFWTLLRPGFLTLVIWVVFSKIMPVPFGNLPVPFWMLVMISVLSWHYFLGALTDATHSLLTNANLLKKVRLDAEVFPIASILANCIHHCLALCIAIPVLFLGGWRPGLEFLAFPVVVAIETMLILGLSFYLSAGNVYYRDVGGALELAGLLLFYITPVIYPVTRAYQSLQESPINGLQVFYMLNPVAAIIVTIRRLVLFPQGNVELPDSHLVVYFGISALVALGLTISGWLVFRRLSRNFADEL